MLSTGAITITNTADGVVPRERLPNWFRLETTFAVPAGAYGLSLHATSTDTLALDARRYIQFRVDYNLIGGWTWYERTTEIVLGNRFVLVEQPRNMLLQTEFVGEAGYTFADGIELHLYPLYAGMELV